MKREIFYKRSNHVRLSHIRIKSHRKQKLKKYASSTIT